MNLRASYGAAFRVGRDHWHMDPEEQLAEARQEEAQALFAAGRAGLERADRLLGLGVSLTAAAAAAGIANGFEQVLLGIPTALSLIYAYVFQVYADVAVMGVGRRRLECVLDMQLGAPALLYETKLAPLRHGDVSPSIPAVQAMYGVLLVGSAIAGGIVAIDIGLAALIIYAGSTMFAACCLALAVRDMRRAGPRAEQAVACWPARSSAASQDRFASAQSR